MDELLISDFIEHHGVKGMHWGVRENRTYSTESYLQRRSSKKAFDKAAAIRFNQRMNDEDYTQEDYNRLSTAKEFVAKNKTIRRVTDDPSLAARGTLYVSHLEPDSVIYRGIIPTTKTLLATPGARSYKKAYEAEYTTLKKLSSPSEKERVDIFTELLSSRAVKVGDKTMTGREYLARTGYRWELKTLSDQEAGVKYYKEFARTLGAANVPLNDPYFKMVAKKGYNALTDDNDRGYLSKAPLIVLNANGTLKVKSVRPLTADEINAAQRSFA